MAPLVAEWACARGGDGGGGRCRLRRRSDAESSAPTRWESGDDSSASDAPCPTPRYEGQPACAARGHTGLAVWRETCSLREDLGSRTGLRRSEWMVAQPPPPLARPFPEAAPPWDAEASSEEVQRSGSHSGVSRGVVATAGA